MALTFQRNWNECLAVTMAAPRAFVRALVSARRSTTIELSHKPLAGMAVLYSTRKMRAVNGRAFHQRSSLLQQPTAETTISQPGNPVVESMTRSKSPAGQDSEDFKHAAFLGEADSNDGHESFRDAYAKPHEALDATNSAYLGEGDSNDSFEIQQDIEGRKTVPLDAKNAAFLGEADSDDAFEMDLEANPEAHRHQIDPEAAKNAAFLGEADSADAREVDRELNPGEYQHKTDDMSPSGMHGEAGSHDQ